MRVGKAASRNLLLPVTLLELLTRATPAGVVAADLVPLVDVPGLEISDRLMIV
jgi:hypothetical protein